MCVCVCVCAHTHGCIAAYAQSSKCLQCHISASSAKSAKANHSKCMCVCVCVYVFCQSAYHSDLMSRHILFPADSSTDTSSLSCRLSLFVSRCVGFSSPALFTLPKLQNPALCPNRLLFDKSRIRSKSFVGIESHCSCWCDMTLIMARHRTSVWSV